MYGDCEMCGHEIKDIPGGGILEWGSSGEKIFLCFDCCEKIKSECKYLW